MSMSDNHKLRLLSPCYTTTILNPQLFSNTSSLPSPPLSEEKTSPELSIPATKVVDAFQHHEHGCLDQSQLEFKLERQEYREVLDYLERNYSLKGWMDCKLRSYNYDPTAGLLEVRMPTRTHELLTVRIVDEIKRSVHQFSTQCVLSSALPTFLNVIENMSSSDIPALDDPDHKRCPDAAFCHPDDQFPGIVIETSYSQRVRNVEKGADEYIMMSNGNIMMVICLDVEYRPNNQQVDTLSVWRAMRGRDQEGPFLYTECILDREPFRDATTKIPINPNRALTIPLNAFAATATLLAHSIPLTDHATTIVTIPFLALANHVTAAQEWDIRRRNLAGTMAPMIVGERKRRRSSTPPETMTREDERAWKRKERLIIKFIAQYFLGDGPQQKTTFYPWLLIEFGATLNGDRADELGSGRDVWDDESGSGRDVKRDESGSGQDVRDDESGSGRDVKQDESGSERDESGSGREKDVQQDDEEPRGRQTKDVAAQGEKSEKEFPFSVSGPDSREFVGCPRSSLLPFASSLEEFVERQPPPTSYTITLPMANLSLPPRPLPSATEILRAMPVFPDLHLRRDYQSADGGGMSSRSGGTGRAPAFHHILPETLVAVERDEVREFREFVDALPFRFHDYTVPPIGLAFSLEADVRSAVERAIILPTLPVIFAMLPDRARRNFDLLFRSENAISGTSSRPDALFTAIFQILSQDLEPDFGYEVIQAIEYKGPGSILDCLAQDLFQLMTPQHPLRIKGGPTNAPTDTWIDITQQLRKYPVKIGAVHQVLMDDCYLIYLEFPSWSDNGENDTIKHQIVPYTQQPTEELMSAREAFVFSVYRGLKANNHLRHLSDGEAIVQFSYQPRLKGTFGGKKRPSGKDSDQAGSSKRITRQSIKGGGNTDSSDFHDSTSSSIFRIDSFATLELDALVEVDSSKLSSRVGHDSGYDSSETNADDLHSGTTIQYLSSFNHCTALFTLKSPLRLSTLSVRPSTLLVVKYFPDYSAAIHEATSYRYCADLQGSVLPYCYGVFTLRQQAGFVLLLSYTPWPTLEDCHSWSSDRWEIVLKKSMAGLERLHSHGVSHCDLRGPNLLVRMHEEVEEVDNIDVMFVDLGYSRWTSTRNPEEGQLPHWVIHADKAHLRLLFRALVARDMDLQE